MVEPRTSWDIVDLTGGSDDGVDHDFENLRVAASKAQHAASRYMKQTTSLEAAHSSQSSLTERSRQHKRDSIDVNRKRSQAAEDPAKALSKSKIPALESENIKQAKSNASRDVRLPAASTDLLQPARIAVDSGLGESVSGTEESRPESQSPTRSSTPQLESNTFSAVDASEYPKPVKTSKSCLNSSGIPQALNGEHPSSKMQLETSIPKKRGRPFKSSSKTTSYQNRKRDSVDDFPSLGAGKKRKRAEDALGGTPLAVKYVKRRRSLSKSLGDMLSLYCDGDMNLEEFLEEIIYPSLKAAVEGRKGLLSEDKLIAIAKTVISKVVDDEFRMFLVESDYYLDRRQRKMIKRSLEETFGQEALLAYNKRNSHNIPSHREKPSPKASLPARQKPKRDISYLDEQDLECSCIPTSAPASYDISLLGPGDSSPPATSVVTQARSDEDELVSSGLNHKVSGRNVRTKHESVPPRLVASKANLTQMNDPTKLSSASVDYGLQTKSDVFHSLRRRSLARDAGTSLDLMKPGKDQTLGFSDNASDVDDLKLAERNYRFDGMREQQDLQRIARRRLLDPQPVSKIEKEDEGGDMETRIIPRTTSSLVHISKLRNPNDKSALNTKQPFLPNKSFRPKNHPTRLDTYSPPQGSHRGNNCSVGSRRDKTSPSFIRDPPPDAPTIVESSQNPKHELTQVILNTKKAYTFNPSSQDIEMVIKQISSYLAGLRNRTEESASASSPDSSVALPISCDPHLVKLAARLAIHEPSVSRPYREADIVPFTLADRHGRLKHVDFDSEECASLSNALMDSGHQVSLPYLRDALSGRKQKDILAFIADLKSKTVATKPGFRRVEHAVVDPSRNTHRSISSILERRELGFNMGNELKSIMSTRLLHWRSWRGASGDVVACAWAPDSTTYAAGAAAHVNLEDQQYNRSCNLLLGDLVSNMLQELPDHRVPRPRPSNLNVQISNEALYDVLDPMMYKTVSSLQFSTDGSELYTASHDSTVKVWDVSRRACLETLYHEGEVTSVEISKIHEGVFATGSKIIDDSVRVYSPNRGGSYEESEDQGYLNFSSSRAQKGRSWEIYPECIRWGLNSLTSHLLLVGFQQWEGLDGPPPAREGQLCLYDVSHCETIKVSPSSQSVHSVAWHPLINLFATGGAARRGLLTNRKTTKTVVRTWDLRNPSSYAMEYECSAIDMQDITFHPQNSHYVTASCTDGNIYVWDFRKPNHYLHCFQHGAPLMDWNHDFPCEEMDPGVMMTIWNEHSTSLFTGSSDGTVKEWDILRSPENALVRDVAQLGAGVQSGAFSPDFSNLLVGDASGAVHILSNTPMGLQADDDDDDDHNDDTATKKPLPITFVHATTATDKDDRMVVDDENPGVEGISAANELLASGELVVDPEFGVGQGPRYKGPYAKWAREMGGEGRVLDELDGEGMVQEEVRETLREKEVEKRVLVQERRAGLEEKRVVVHEKGARLERAWWADEGE